MQQTMLLDQRDPHLEVGFSNSSNNGSRRSSKDGTTMLRVRLSSEDKGQPKPVASSPSSSSSVSTTSSTDSSSAAASSMKSDVTFLSTPTTKAAAFSTSKGKNQNNIATPTWSANVVFYPPSNKYWRIGGNWYDLTKFASRHPGGAQVLELARDRFEDCTYVFEAHHHNYKQARKILEKYRVPASQVEQDGGIKTRPSRQETTTSSRNQCPFSTHHDKLLDANISPILISDDSFYSVLRQRVDLHLKKIGCPGGEPTWGCLVLFGTVLTTWFGMVSMTLCTGSLVLAALTGIVRAVLGSFGHNWIHQPRYKHAGFGLISMDLVGYSSEAWFRDHVLQHHMYTNTPWDQHLHGTDPFIVTDPTVPRGFLHANITPYMLHILLCFGTYVNYLVHTSFLFAGSENWSIGKLFFPLEHFFFWNAWGWYGLVLAFVMNAVTANYYFTIALMNHNAEHTQNVTTRNESKDWGEAQLHASADFCGHYSFLKCMPLLWLNNHTVHHLFPKIDFSHHPAIQKILIETCREFDIGYVDKDPWTIYKEMIRTFTTPYSLAQEIVVYAGSI